MKTARDVANELRKKSNANNNATMDARQVAEQIRLYNSLPTDSVDEKYINSFMSDAKSFFGGFKDGNTPHYTDATTTLKDLETRSNTIQGWLYKNKSRLDEKTYNELSSVIGQFHEGIGSTQKHYSQWSNAEEYDEYLMGWLNPESGVNAENSADRKAKYEKNKARIDELEAMLSSDSSWLPKRTDDKFSLRPEMKTRVDERKALNDELEALKAENLQYERTQGVLDNYYIPETDEFLANASFRDYSNASREDLWEINTNEDYINSLLASGSYKFDEYGNIVNTVSGDIFYEADDISKAMYKTSKQTSGDGLLYKWLGKDDEYVNYRDQYYNSLVQDKLGMYLSASEDDYLDAVSELGAGAGDANNTWAEILRDGEALGWKYLKDNEINIYYDLLKREGQESAYRYLDAMSTELTRRATKERADNIANASGLEQVALNIASIPMNILGGGIAFIEDTANVIQGNDINPYSAAHSWQNDAQAIRYNTAMDINNLTGNVSLPWLGATFGDAYQAVMSYGDSMVGLGLTGGAYSTLMGMGAASSTMKDMYERGASIGQMTAGGLLAGAAEMIFETVSIEALIKTGNSKTWRDVIVNYLKQSGIEASEEMFTEIANTITDCIVMGSQSNWVDFETFIKNVLNAGLGGFISGGLGGGIVSTVNKMAYDSGMVQHGQNLIDHGSVEALKQFAFDNASVSSIAELYSKVASDPSAKNVGKLSYLMEDTISSRNRTEIENALIEKGLNKREAKRVSEYLANADNLTQDQIKEINGDERIGAVVDELLANPDSEINSRSIDLMSARYGFYTKKDTSTTQATEESTKENGEVTIPESKTTPTAETIANEGLQTSETTTETVAEEEETVTLAEASVKYGTQAQAMIHTYTEGQNVAQYDKAYQVAYDMGRSGVSLSYVMNSDSTSYLTESQRELAYEAGKASSETSAKEKDAKNKQSANGKTGRKKGRVKGDGVTIKDLKARFNDTQNKAYKTLTTIAEVTGYDFVLFKSEMDEKGNFVGEQGRFKINEHTIGIDINAGLNTIDDVGDLAKYSMLRTFNHEFVHSLEQDSPVEYNALRKAVFEALTERGIDVDQLIKDKMDQYADEGLTYEQASREVVAEALTDILPDSHFIEILATKHQNLFQKILAKLKEFINSIKEYFNSLNPNTLEEANALKVEVDGAMHYLESIVELFDKAAVNAVETYQSKVATDTKAKKTETKVETKVETKTDVEKLEEAGIGLDEDTQTVYALRHSIARRDASGNVVDLVTVGKKEFNIESIAQLVSKATGRSIEDARKWVNSEVTIANIVMNNPEFLDFEADNRYEAIKKNSDYPQGTVDLSNLCPKRTEFTSMFDMLQKKYPNKLFTASDVASMREILKSADITVACGACFVEDRRQLLGEIADTYIGMWKEAVETGKPLQKTNAEGKKITLKVTSALAKQYGLKQGSDIIATDTYIPTQYDLTTYEGFKLLEKNHPTIAMGFNRYNNSRGQQAGRLIEGRAEYNRQILGWSDTKVRSVNNNGGLRIFSFSDFEVVHLLDLVQIILDCAAKGVKIQGYTKIPSFAKLVRNTGIKLNRSLIPKGQTGVKTVNGKQVLDIDIVEGIDINDENFIDESDNPDIGNIIIGINPTQIGIAMLDDFIDYIIPFHTNKSKAICQQLGVGEWVNYKESQHERDISTGKASKHNVNIYTQVINKYHPKNKVEFVNAFLEECRKQKKIPRYSEFLNKEYKADGTYQDEYGAFDYTYREGYHKFPIDFKMFDKEGNILPQGNITPELDNEFMAELLQAEVDKKQNYEFPQEVYDRLDKEFGEDKVQLSKRNIQPITEKEYQDLEKHFGTTGNFKVAGYLLTDAKLLDFSGKHWGDTTSRTRHVDHRDVEPVLHRGNNGIDSMIDMIGSGNIRLMPEIGGINLAVYPNEKQRRVLSTYINYMLNTEGEVVIDYDEVGGDTVYSKTYGKTATSRQILNDIRNYFNGGRQSELMSFHTQYSKRVTSEQDAKYMDAVTKGDMETAQRMVDEAAKEAGYDSPKLYHGTKMFGFTEVKTSGVEKGVAWSPFFAANKEDISASYVPYGKVRDISSSMDDDAIEEAREIAIEERKEKISDLVDDFRSLIDRYFSPWVFGQTDNSYLEGLVEEANPEAGHGDGVYDVLSEIVYDSFYDYQDEFGEYEDADDWSENSPEGNKIFSKITEIEGEKSALHRLESGEELGGIYQLYANLDNMYVVDGKGVAWNELRPEGLPKIERYGVKDAPYKTRDVAEWARDNGFDGVIFKNIKDNGEYGRTPAGDVYAFFNPESQVKSADPVTYDDDGNIIPLSERFNTENDDIRYSKRNTSYAPTFYSHMGKVVDGIKIEKMGANGVVSYLKGRGVKDEEIKWSGIETFLEGKKSVTKAELQEFVASSQLQIEEESISDVKWSEYKLDGGTNYREIVFKMPNSSYSNDSMRMHWGQDAEGILVHARIQDMTTSDGKKMLFIEEIQSDWHNEGAKEGYADGRIEKRAKLYSEIGNALHDFDDPNHMQRAATLREELRKLDAELQADGISSESAPDAPFKDTYHEYVLKRLLRMAAEEGYDSIGWTPAYIQSERWSDRYAEGYRIEYDQEMPKFLRKYGKKWGATVDKANIKQKPLGARERILKENELENVKRDLKKAKKQLDRISRSYERAFVQSSIDSMEKTIATLEKELSESLSVWSMDIPDSMKDSVLYEGQVQYSKRNYREGLSEADIKIADEVISNLRIQAMASTYGIRSMGTYTMERMDREIATSSSDTVLDYAKSYITWVDPQDFIYATTTSEEFREQLKKEAGDLDIEKLRNQTQPIHLTVDFETKQIVGHEGRHRMLALSKAGVSKVAVIIDAHNDDRHNTKPIEFMKLKGQQFAKYQSGTDFYLHNILPLSLRYSDVAREMFANKPKKGVQFQYRTSTFSDREVLELASEQIRIEDLTKAEKEALDVFKSRLGKLKTLQEERREKGKLWHEQQFGEDGDRAEASKTRNRMKILDNKIEKAMAEVLSVEEKKVLGQVLKKARKVVETAERERNQDILKRWRDRRDNAAAIKKYRDRIFKDANDLYDWITKPDSKSITNHVPEVLRGAVVDFLESINFMSNQALNGGDVTKSDKVFIERMYKVREAVHSGIKAYGLYSGYTDLPEDFMDTLDSYIKIADVLMKQGKGEFIINQMTSEELQSLSKLVANIKQYIKNFNRFHYNSMYQHVYEAGDDSIGFLEVFKNAGDRTGTMSNFLFWQQIRPAYAFERFGKGGEAIWDGLRRGQSKLAFNSDELVKFSAETYTKDEATEWEKDIKEFRLGSDIVKIPVSYIMGLSMLYNDADGKRHILEGGIRVATYKHKGKKISDNGHSLTLGEFNQIVGTLTDRQKEVASKLQKFMATKGAEWGNYVTMARYGEESFTNPNYYPINSDGRYLPATVEEHPSAAALYALLNMSFTKQRNEKANNRVVIYSIFDVFANHMASMAQYNAMALPILDTLKWFNYEQVSIDDDGNRTVLGSLRREMARVYGVPEETKPGSGKAGYAEAFVTNIIKDFNGTSAHGTQYDTLGLKALRVHNMAQVAYNLRVVAQQPMSITRAGMLIDYKSILKGMSLKPKVIAQNIEEMKKYSGIALWKSLGFYDVNISRGLTQIIKHASTWRDTVADIGLWGAEKADALTWAAMWSACKEEVIRKQKIKPTDQGFFEAVTKLFEDVIYKTQVVDSVLTKNEYIRDKGFVARALGSFMSESTTNASMLVDAVDKYNLDLKRGMSKQEAWKKNSKMIGRRLYVYGLGAVLISVMTAMIDALRDDDDYEEWYEKFLDAFGGNLVDELMPFNKLPIVSDFYDLSKALLSKFGVDTYGNPPQSVIMQWYDSLVKGTEIIADKILGEDTNYTWYGGIYKLLQATSSMVGLPMASATREAVTVWNNTVGAMAPSLKVHTYESSEMSKIRNAYSEGNLTYEEAVQHLLEQGLVDTEDEAYFTVQGWETGEGYSRYDKVFDAVLKGESIDEAMAELTSHGYTEKDVQSSIKSQVGKWYSDSKSDVRITKQQAIQMLEKYTDMTDNEITSTINKWSCVVVTGIKYDDIDDEFMKGSITSSRAIEMYSLYGSMSREKATEKVEVLKFVKDNPDCEDITYSAVNGYNTYCKHLSIPVKTYYNAWKHKSSLSGSGEVKEQMMAYINSLNLSSRQKDALYLAFGWAESKLYQAPWH